MKTKTYIAALLAFVFLAKFIAIDANALNILFDGNNISFVKPFCKKKNAPKLAGQTMDFSQADSMTSQDILFSGFCTSQFQFELLSWTTHTIKPITVFNDYLTSRLSYRYLESVSPPPRLA
ncbi:hypothetical protein [Winogradskyella vidalii]|uniref:hypothetical protein n=1 Tax=Winogradskyella vidalii TaxID=2615024 RepID=UPI00293BB7B4|nr:hypothetical protein [Winogradskyella vidalii]